MNSMPPACSDRPLSVDTLPCAAAYADACGCVLVTNEAFEALWAGCGCGSTLARHPPLASLFAADEHDALARVITAPLALARPLTREMQLAGSRASIIAEFAPIAHDSGVVWLLMLRPPSMAAHTQRLGSQESLRAALQAGVAHDLRDPLQVVLAWVSILKQRHDDPHRVERALTIIERNVKLQMALLEELLELSRPPCSPGSFHRGPIDLAELIITVVHGLEPSADERGVRLLLTVNSPAMLVMADAVHLRRIVGNLLSHSLTSALRGETVECHVSGVAGWARLIVSDNGRAIRREGVPRLFDPFHEDGDGAVSQAPLGLGLCVVRHLVELHGGRIIVDSAVSGRGVTFTVLLPAVFNVPAAVSTSHSEYEIR